MSNLVVAYAPRRLRACVEKKQQRLSRSTLSDRLLFQTCFFFGFTMNSPVTIRLEREATDRPWGFRLQGWSESSSLSLTHTLLRFRT